MSVPEIAEITHAIYQGFSKRRLCKEYVGRKVNNKSGFNLRRSFAFACPPSLSPSVITWLEPAIQLKNQYELYVGTPPFHTNSIFQLVNLICRV